MVNMTLAVSDKLKRKMDDFPEINWSAVAREAISNKIELLEQFREFTKKSIITEKDSLEFGRRVNKALQKQYSNEAHR